jgi:hypothetical protein
MQTVQYSNLRWLQQKSLVTGPSRSRAKKRDGLSYGDDEDGVLMAGVDEECYCDVHSK